MNSRLPSLVQALICLSLFTLSSPGITANSVVVIPLVEEVTAEHWKGAWDISEEYTAGDIVENEGSTYIARATISPGNLPPHSNSDWDMMAQAGQDGSVGAAGPQGCNRSSH